MGISQHIESLLYRYQCVVVPTFGAFLTQNKSAFLQKESNTFFPPSRELSFNAQLQSNDGLLISHISQVEKMPYDEALKFVEGISADWLKEIREKGHLRLEGLGEFKLNSEGNIRFKPFDRNNFLTSSFGLGAVMANPISREVYKEEISALEERVPFSITPEKRNSFGLRPFLKYAAIVLLTVSVGVSGYSWYQNQNKIVALAQSEAQKQVSARIQEATFFDSEPLQLPSLVLEISRPEPEILSHHIIAGAFRVKENADRKIAELQELGYPASYVGENSFGLHQVAYGSYAEAQEALEALKQLKRSHSEAWLLSQR
jgi:hypothetical protein